MSAKNIILKDYHNYYSDRVLKMRKRIQITHSKVLSVILKRKYNRLLYRCQSYLPVSKLISNDITFPHGLSGIFISNGAKIGCGCVIFQQVTIGSNALKDSRAKGSPTIGKNCYIGAGAKIIGNVIIGDNVRIGANTVVTKDVPNNATVVGARCRVIKHDYKLCNGFVIFENKDNNEK